MIFVFFHHCGNSEIILCIQSIFGDFTITGLLTLYLRNVVLVCLGRKGHSRHSHHDVLVGGIHCSRWGL